VNPENQNGKDTQNHDLAELKHFLRRAIPPIPSSKLEPRADLWPRLRARIDSQHRADRAHAPIPIRIHWFDWALAALATAALVFFPGIIPALLYHF